MSVRAVIRLCLCAMVFSACSLRNDGSGRAIDLVSEIIAGEEANMNAALHSYRPDNPMGDIVIVDDPLRAAMLSAVLLESDGHDNIDGGRISDRLPDFAGERIVSQFDIDRTYALAADSVLRETAVRALAASLDTVCFSNAYDSVGVYAKNAAKVLVMASPTMAAAARFDVDTLLAATGVGLPVVYPAYDMLAAADAAGCTNVAIVSDMPHSDSYMRICSEIGVRYQVYFACVDSLGGGDVLEGLLESYYADGRRAAIDCVVIDTYKTGDDRFRDEYAGILLDGSMSSLHPLISEGCAFISAGKSVADSVYALLRGRNLFTHDVSYPRAGVYITRPADGGVYSLMQMDWSLLPAGLENDIMTEASQTYVSYVQD